MEDILNRIIGIRKAKKISQKEISESLGISQAAYAKFESGNSITVDRLYKIAEFLSVSINEILDVKPTKQNEDLNESLILKIDSLNETIKEKTLLINLLKDEKLRIKDFLVSTMIENYSFEIRDINEQILKIANEKEKAELIRKKESIDKFFKHNKERFFKTGFISQTDFDNYYKDMREIYSDSTNTYFKGSETP